MPRCGTPASSSRVGFAVPTSKPRYTWRESALTMSDGVSSASRSAIAVFPAAVGPQMTSTSPRSVELFAAEASLNLVPRELHDRRAAMHVVRGKRRIAQRDEQRAHLSRRQRVARLDRRLARDRRGESFMARMRSRLAIAGERRERFAQTAFGIEAWMRHRHGPHD